MEIAEVEKMAAHIAGLGKRLRQFYECFFAEDYDGVLLLTYPNLFNLIPKNRMREKLYETLHNDTVDFTCDELKIDKIGDLVSHEEGDFVKLDYTILMALHFKADEHANLKKKRYQQKKTLFLTMFEEKYGKENIWFDEITRSYCIYKKNCLVGFKDEVSLQWTFLTMKKGLMMEAFLPDDVRIIFEADMGEE